MYELKSSHFKRFRDFARQIALRKPKWLKTDENTLKIKE